MEDVSKVVKTMRARVFAATKLTCSAGIGPSFMIAKVLLVQSLLYNFIFQLIVHYVWSFKVASDFNKPDGQFEVDFNVDAAVSFMRKLPIRKVSSQLQVVQQLKNVNHNMMTLQVGGIGKVTERVLREVTGVETVQDVYDRRIEVTRSVIPTLNHISFMQMSCSFQILHVFTPSLGEFLFKVSFACSSDEREVSLSSSFVLRQE